jgi:cyclohexadieny/prephenate dehydrogenase
VTGVIYPKLAVIGCGLIGSSVARAARAHGVVEAIAVADADVAVRERVVALGLADSVHDDPAEAVRDADLVIFATPPLSIEAAAWPAAGALKPGATVSDVGSVKAAIAEAFARTLPDTVFAIPDTRSPAPNTPAPTRASPPCSRTAGPSSRRRTAPTHPTWRPSSV